MNVLVLYEFSGVVREAFRRRGHDARSVDYTAALDGSRNHYQDSVQNVVGAIARRSWGWVPDVVIAHPSCVRLTNAGVRWLYKDGRGKVVDPKKWAEMEAGANEFRWLLGLPFPRMAVENPVMHDHAMQIIGKPYTQIIQPWMFGHGEIKKTCLWLRGLSKLKPTKVVSGRKPRVHHESPGVKNGLTRSQRRSITYPGIGDAFAEQWGTEKGADA